MPRFYQRKFCLDGTINPQWKPRKSGKSGRRLSKWSRGEFVAWDTEGAEIEGRHECIVLLNSANSSLVDPRGLDTCSLLDTIAEGIAQNAKAVHVGFVFSYDVNMILRDLPRERVAELWQLGETAWRTPRGVYVLRYTPRKEFSVTRIRGDQRIGGVIWDVFGYFQSSFVDALRSYGVDAETVDRIASMKAQRSEFDVSQLPEIIAYCREECTLLAELMGTVHGYMRDAGLQVSRWDGAGAVAGAILRREGVKAYKGELPPPVEIAARHAYFGGRIELLHYGHDPALHVYEADIRSAYPAATVSLPCLACGTWTRSSGWPDPAPTFAVARVRWDFTPGAPFYPFPWRANDGAVYFPPRGEGWYWLPEIDAARAAWGAHGWRVLEAWSYATPCTHAPFGFVPELYQTRAEWKRQGRGAEKMLKLGLNSLYGKLAQRIATRGLPPYYQVAWAGWITSSTRATLHRAAWEIAQRGRVLMFATDAILSDVRPDVLEAESLGAWELSEYDGITLAQSGVYWAGPLESRPKSRVRGFDPGSLERAGVVESLRRSRPKYRASLTRFVGMGRALASESAWDTWRTWRTEPRELSLVPGGKRESARQARGRRPWRELLPTLPRDPAHERESQGMLSAPVDPPAARRAGLHTRADSECAETVWD